MSVGNIMWKATVPTFDSGFRVLSSWRRFGNYNSGFILLAHHSHKEQDIIYLEFQNMKRQQNKNRNQIEISIGKNRLTVQPSRIFRK